jgi:hypothetical protein
MARKPKPTPRPIDDDAEAEFAEVPHFKPDALIGQVTDFLLMELRDAKEKKPWAAMSESEQRWLIERAQGQARAVVAGIVRTIAAKGFEKIDAISDGGSWKDGEISLKLKARLTPENLEAVSTGGNFVQVIFASVEQFDGDGAIKAAPDQRPMFDDEDDAETWTDPHTGEVMRGPRQIGHRGNGAAT